MYDGYNKHLFGITYLFYPSTFKENAKKFVDCTLFMQKFFILDIFKSKYAFTKIDTSQSRISNQTQNNRKYVYNQKEFHADLRSMNR
uniref:Uncharacterized protein n=1 Tax=Panagrolaimus sp. JU765 TaxID=591449 RepID=A0AC34QJA8_9BILA